MIETLPSYELYNSLYNRDTIGEDRPSPDGFSMEIDINLKQIYKPGEIISGTVTMMNDSSLDIETDGLFVSLIGVQSITNVLNPISPIIIDSKIIEMHELSLLDKVIPMGVTQKEFNFVVPWYLLDNTCPHQIPDHLQIPSTFGKKNDYTTPGQKIRYGINAQLLPWKDFKFVEIGISSKDTPFEKMKHSSTMDQLKLVNKYIDEEIDVLNERLTLHKLGISNIRNQNEIIFDSKGSGKGENLFNEFKVIDLQNSETNCSPNSFLSAFEVNKSMFNQGTKMFVSMEANQAKLGSKVPIEIISYSKEPPFNTVTFCPNLFAINYQSQYPIPVRFDNEFLLSAGFNVQCLKTVREKFSERAATLSALNKQLNLQYSESLQLEMALSLSKLHAQHIKTDVLKPVKLTEIQWELFDKDQWRFSYEIPIDFTNSQHVNMIAQFQNCYLGRFYIVSMEISSGKQNWKMNNKFIFNF